MRVITERKVDELGRVVIPLNIRERYHIFPGDSVRIVEDTDGISVEPNLSLCRLCGAPLPEEGEYLLCDECLSDIRRESHSAPKVIPLVFTNGREGGGDSLPR